jgi:hypothetical protein
MGMTKPLVRNEVWAIVAALLPEPSILHDDKALTSCAAAAR